MQTVWRVFREYTRSLNIFRTRFSWGGRITFRLKVESTWTFRHRISLSRVSESTPAVVQENGLAVRKRLALLPKAIGVSPLFIGMILPRCSQLGADSVDQIQYEAREREFFFRTITEPARFQYQYNRESRVSHPPRIISPLGSHTSI